MAKYKKKKYKKKKKIDSHTCRLCNEKTKLHKCKYCKEYFCKEHLKAKPPGMPRFKGTSYEDRLFMEEWHKPGGHPCPPYLDHWKAKNEREKQEYGLALDKLLKSKPIQFEKEEKWQRPKDREFTTKKKKSKRYEYKWSEPKDEKPIIKKKQKNYIKYIIFILIILLAVFLFINFSNKDCSDGTVSQNCSITQPFFCQKNGSLTENSELCGCPENERAYQNGCVQIIKCEDGTLHPECSENKPYQCVNGSLVKRASICGCPDEYMRKGKSNSCELIQRCEDGTIYDQCSNEKPLFCSEGNLINKATVCGCPIGSNIKQEGEKCIDITRPDELQIEGYVHDLVNVERKNFGLQTLSWDSELADVARAHSLDMAFYDFFDHVNLEGEDPTDRGNNVGYVCHKDYGSYYMEGIAENIHQGWTYSSINYVDYVEVNKDYLSAREIAELAVDGWMNSPGHRQNILSSDYDREGIGVAISFDKKVLITQDFC